ncbi:MAG: universal stress protein [Gemmatimonadota bacterium]
MRPLSLRTILIATDLSDAMMPALRTAVQLADLADADLHVVHGGERPGSVEQLQAHLSRGGVRPETIGKARTIEGPAGAMIVQEALRLEADVIVLGPHREKDTGSIGSTADRVVRAAPIPCLILPRALPLPLGNVLVPVDAAESARGPLAVGLTWASALRRRARDGGGTDVVALHVTPTGASNSAAVRRLQQEIDTVRQHLASLAGVDIRQSIDESNDPSGVILRQAESLAVDLVVLGTRAEKAVDGAMLGSVSSAVVCRATTPVLLVPPGIWRSTGREPLP